MQPAVGVLPAVCLPWSVLARRGKTVPARVGGVWNETGSRTASGRCPGVAKAERSLTLPARLLLPSFEPCCYFPPKEKGFPTKFADEAMQGRVW